MKRCYLILLAVLVLGIQPAIVSADEYSQPHQWTNEQTMRSKLIFERGGTLFHKGYTVPYIGKLSGGSGFIVTGLESRLYLIDPSKAPASDTGYWSYGTHDTGMTPGSKGNNVPSFYYGSGVTVFLPTVNQRLDGVILTFMNKTGVTGFSLYGTAVGSQSGTTHGASGGMAGSIWPYEVGDYITVMAQFNSSVSWVILDHRTRKGFNPGRTQATQLSGQTKIASVDSDVTYYYTGTAYIRTGLTGFFVPANPSLGSVFVLDPEGVTSGIANAIAATQSQHRGWGHSGAGLNRSGITVNLPIPTRFIDGWEITLQYSNKSGAVSGTSEIFPWCADLPIGYTGATIYSSTGVSNFRLLYVGNVIRMRAAYNSGVCWWVLGGNLIR